MPATLTADPAADLAVAEDEFAAVDAELEALTSRVRRLIGPGAEQAAGRLKALRSSLAHIQRQMGSWVRDSIYVAALASDAPDADAPEPDEFDLL